MTTTVEPTGTYEGVPAYHFDDSIHAPVLWHQLRWDELSRRHPHFRSDVAQGYWVLTRGESVRRALQDWQTFSSSSVSPTDPDPQYLWIPEMLDPPVHTDWRRLLAPTFSPSAVSRREAEMRAVAAGLIERIKDLGECDVLDEFARRFPTTIFMRIMGLPETDLELFLGWIDEILHLSLNDDPDRSRMLKAVAEVATYFEQLIADRRTRPRDDLLSNAMGWQVAGQPISDRDLHAFCLLMFQAGLDTVPIQLGYSFYHLATHPEHRRRLVSEPGVIPTAVEEILRVYTFVVPSRKATRDIVVDGCPIKAGEMVTTPLPVVNRDPERYPNPDEVDLDRTASNHIAFGAGPHRCLGSNLARLELVVAMQEWHRRIPEYELVPGQDLSQHGSMYGIKSLRLRW